MISWARAAIRKVLASAGANALQDPAVRASRLVVSQAYVNGDVRLKIYKGNVTVLSRTSEKSLYVPDLATFEADTVYDQADAEGFIRLNALRLQIGAKVHKP